MKPAYSSCLAIERADAAGRQQLGEADDVGERRAQLVGYVVDEIVAQLLGRNERLIALGQRALDIGARGHVERGEKRRPVRKRQCGAIEREAVVARDPRRPAFAVLVEADDHVPQSVPQRGILAKRPAAAPRSHRYAGDRAA